MNIKTERLMSLDVFRGITIAGMILVNNPGSWSYVYPALRHAVWHGCTPTDLVFPFFLFIMGVAITISLTKKKVTYKNQTILIITIIRRSLILILLGMILNAFPDFDFATIRIPGVLQRIGIVYLISSIIFLKMNDKQQYIVSILILVLYWLVLTIIPVPNVGYPNLEPNNNLAAWLDNLLLKNHLWKHTKVWDPEGILTTFPAIVTTMIGMFVGKFLLSKYEKLYITSMLFFYGNVLFLLGYIWSVWFPLNKNLWTSSYVLYTGGLAIIFLSSCYLLIEVLWYKKWAKPFQIFGLNAITVYFLSELIGRILFLIKIDSKPINMYLFDNYFLSWLEPYFASLLWAIVYVLVWLFLMWILYRKNIFIKI